MVEARCSRSSAIAQIIDELVLAMIHPARQDGEQEMEWIEDFRHLVPHYRYPDSANINHVNSNRSGFRIIPGAGMPARVV